MSPGRRRSRFTRCADHDIFIRSWGSANGNEHPLRGFLIENNFFDATLAGHYSLRLAQTDGWPCERFVIRNNSALQNMYSDCDAQDVRFVANIQPSMSRHVCRVDGGARWDWNVYGDGVACGANDLVANPAFRARGRFDLHLWHARPPAGMRTLRASQPAISTGNAALAAERPTQAPTSAADEQPSHRVSIAAEPGRASGAGI